MYESAAKFSTAGGYQKAAIRTRVIDTLLKEGIPLTEKGIRKAADLIDSLNTKVDDIISAHEFGAKYPREFTVRTLNKLADDQIGLISGAQDAAIIRKVADDFLSGLDQLESAGKSKFMTLKELQEWKQNAYKRINWKNPLDDQVPKNLAYKEASGQVRQDVQNLTPDTDIASLNRREGAVIEALDPLTQSVLRSGNRNAFGMDTFLAPATGGLGAHAFGIDPAIGVGVGAVKNIAGMPAIKSKLAIAIYNARLASGADKRLAESMVIPYLQQLNEQEGSR